MAVSSRLIKRRIRSVANTRKITKAMELVAASKMRKSVQLAVSSRAYSSTLTRVVDDIRTLIDPKLHPLLTGRGGAPVDLIVVAASDRGLCGGFNGQLLKKTVEFLRSRSSKEIRIVTVGKRAELAMRRTTHQIAAAFEAISSDPSFARTRPIGELIYREFIEQKVDRIFLVYTNFRSAISQVPAVVQLLPVIPEAELSRTSEQETEQESDTDVDTYAAESPGEQDEDEAVLFEPHPRQILDALLPRLLETQIYQALLESSASEHSARMMAMRNATENASEMLQDLTLTFNQARQAGITREISEISAGKAALE